MFAVSTRDQFLSLSAGTELGKPSNRMANPLKPIATAWDQERPTYPNLYETQARTRPLGW